jgi:rhodanese-related sulfurtransferase
MGRLLGQIVGLMIAAGLIMPVLGCDSPAGSDNTEAVSADAGPDAGGSGEWPSDRFVTAEALYQRVQLGDPEMLLLNVVDEEFYDLGHIEGSLVIPWDLLEGRLDEVDPSKHVVIYCRRGARSDAAYDTLTANGYSLLWILEHGLERWIELGYPTVAN